MLTYAAILLLGAILALALRRVAIWLLSRALLVVGVVVAGRIAVLIDGRLADASWSGAVIVGGLAGLAAFLLGYVWIWNAIVRADLERQLERDKQQAKARMI